MQLPTALQHFPHATLIVSADTVHADLFLVGGDSLEYLDRIAVPREKREDAEGEWFAFNGTHAAGPDSDIPDKPRLVKFVKQLVDRIDNLVRKHEITKVHLLMPAVVSHTLTADLPGDELVCAWRLYGLVPPDLNGSNGTANNVEAKATYDRLHFRKLRHRCLVSLGSVEQRRVCHRRRVASRGC